MSIRLVAWAGAMGVALFVAVCVLGVNGAPDWTIWATCAGSLLASCYSFAHVLCPPEEWT